MTSLWRLDLTKLLRRLLIARRTITPSPIKRRVIALVHGEQLESRDMFSADLGGSGWAFTDVAFPRMFENEPDGLVGTGPFATLVAGAADPGFGGSHLYTGRGETLSRDAGRGVFADGFRRSEDGRFTVIIISIPAQIAAPMTESPTPADMKLAGFLAPPAAKVTELPPVASSFNSPFRNEAPGRKLATGIGPHFSLELAETSATRDNVALEFNLPSTSTTVRKSEWRALLSLLQGDDQESAEKEDDIEASVDLTKESEAIEEGAFTSLRNELEALDEVLANLEPFRPANEWPARQEANHRNAEPQEGPHVAPAEPYASGKMQPPPPIEEGGMVLLEAFGDPNSSAGDIILWSTMDFSDEGIANLEPEAVLGVHQSMDIGMGTPIPPETVSSSTSLLTPRDSGTRAGSTPAIRSTPST